MPDHAPDHLHPVLGRHIRRRRDIVHRGAFQRARHRRAGGRRGHVAHPGGRGEHPDLVADRCDPGRILRPFFKQRAPEVEGKVGPPGLRPHQPDKEPCGAVLRVARQRLARRRLGLRRDIATGSKDGEIGQRGIIGRRRIRPGDLYHLLLRGDRGGEVAQLRLVARQKLLPGQVVRIGRDGGAQAFHQLGIFRVGRCHGGQVGLRLGLGLRGAVGAQHLRPLHPVGDRQVGIARRPDIAVKPEGPAQKRQHREDRHEKRPAHGRGPARLRHPVGV